MKNHSRALDIGAKSSSPAVSKNSTAALFTIPDLITFCHTGIGFYRGKFVYNFKMIIVCYKLLPISTTRTRFK